ncbi:MAG: DUF3570 domain-containing protein [Planctomycetota bacterium]
MRLLLIAALVAASTAGVARAQDDGPKPGAFELDPGESVLWTQLGFYSHDDGPGDGNPFLDEELTVIEPLLIFDHQVDEDWGFGVTLSYDHVSSASIDRLSKFPAQSGASGDNYVGVDYASRHRTSANTSLDWHAGFSFEYDYLSLGAGLSRTVRTPAEGRSDTYGFNFYYDVVDIIRYDGDQSEGTDGRLTLTGTWTRSQPLSRYWTGELTSLLTLQNGFLETPYNAVVLEDPGLPANPNLDNGANGIEITEELPDTRIRLALRPRARRWMSERSALELGGRIYADDWGVVAAAIEPRWYYDLVADRLRMRLRYRYYVQSAADDYRETFLQAAGTPEFRTQDSDLADLDSHTFGVRFDAFGKSGRPTWHLDLNYALRSDGLDHAYVALGYRFGF